MPHFPFGLKEQDVGTNVYKQNPEKRLLVSEPVHGQGEIFDNPSGLGLRGTGVFKKVSFNEFEFLFSACSVAC